MACRETRKEAREMSTADMATGYVRRMVENETRGWGDQDNALSRLEARYGLPYWSLQNLRMGRAKTVEASLYNRIKAAFVDHCGKQAARLLHEAQMAKVGNPDVDVADIENQIRALASKLEAAKGNAARAVR
jgi:hypothetical protein